VNRTALLLLTACFCLFSTACSTSRRAVLPSPADETARQVRELPVVSAGDTIDLRASDDGWYVTVVHRRSAIAGIVKYDRATTDIAVRRLSRGSEVLIRSTAKGPLWLYRDDDREAAFLAALKEWAWETYGDPLNTEETASEKEDTALEEPVEPASDP
jgi:hypothetical protein